MGGQQVYVSRTGYTGELGYEIYSQGEATDHPALWAHLMAAGEPHGMEFSCANSMEIRRIEAGILDNTTDMDMTMTPFEAGLGAFVDMAKDSFIGREALQDADRRSLIFGVKCQDAMPIMNDLVHSNDRPVGRITAGAWSPYLECHVGYVRLNEPGEWHGQNVSLQAADEKRYPIDIVDLPFYDPDKRIVRGLDTTIP